MLLFVGTHGPDDPTLACMPFSLAVAAAEAGMHAMIHLRGEAVTLLLDSAIAAVIPVDLPPLHELLCQVQHHHIPVYV
jgi:uncharacterized protein involved in oxidation of intracellular sulfur